MYWIIPRTRRSSDNELPDDLPVLDSLQKQNILLYTNCEHEVFNHDAEFEKRCDKDSQRRSAFFVYRCRMHVYVLWLYLSFPADFSRTSKQSFKSLLLYYSKTEWHEKHWVKNSEQKMAAIDQPACCTHRAMQQTNSCKPRYLRHASIQYEASTTLKNVAKTKKIAEIIWSVRTVTQNK